MAARELKVKRLDVRCDSLLIVSQFNDNYVAKDAKMSAYLDFVNRLTKSFIRQVPREKNS